MHVRIVKRVSPDHAISFVVQGRFCYWVWVDMVPNDGFLFSNGFSSLEYAKKAVRYLEATLPRDEVVFSCVVGDR